MKKLQTKQNKKYKMNNSKKKKKKKKNAETNVDECTI